MSTNKGRGGGGGKGTDSQNLPPIWLPHWKVSLCLSGLAKGKAYLTGLDVDDLFRVWVSG